MGICDVVVKITALESQVVTLYILYRYFCRLAWLTFNLFHFTCKHVYLCYSCHQIEVSFFNQKETV